MNATRSQRRLTRRQFLPAAAGAATIGVAGLAGYELHGSASPQPGPSTSAAAATSASGGNPTFVTEPNLRPPLVKITNLAGHATTPRFIFLAPTNYLPQAPYQQGLMIVDRQGRLVWFSPITTGKPFDFNSQDDKGRQVLSWWSGAVVSAHGEGAGELADSSYRTIRSVDAGGGLQTDLHELTLTSRGTALITAYETANTDLSSVGGPRQGRTFVGHAQEIDLVTGKLLFDWRCLDHVPVNESYQPIPNRNQGYDYFHINSVAEMEDGNLLISARNTWALYKVDRSTGHVIWRLNGKRSDFRLAGPARFYWQHDARAVGPSQISVFDNAGPKREKSSRGVLLSVDTSAMQVDLKQAYLHPAAFQVDTQGSMQNLPDGRVFIGWGDQPYFSEFAADGTLTLDGQLPVAVRSYRAYTADWVGHPQTPPLHVARENPAGGVIVHASWNGATEIAGWAVLAGATKGSLTQVGSQPWTGFETAIAVNSVGPYFSVVALDANGQELGRSEVT